MRRKDKLITDPERLHQIISDSPYMVMGLANDNVPYAVPLDFVFDGENIYFHCAREGRKLDMLARNPEVWLLFVNYGGIFSSKADGTACSYSTRFASVMARGRAEIIDDPEQKKHVFKLMMAKIGKEDLPLRPGMLEVTCVVKVNIQEMEGKQSPRVKPAQE
ncbi:MAG: pyridoxamine 5'-phosphate oxidase family protein [Desulfovibrionaceae bacterium]|nr:pyridoxamine 5'-phosphate oxidase family protein [Desulfovibrionaceae bacterium]